MKKPQELLARYRFYVVQLLTLQLFLFLLSFPVLLLWGMPISIMAIISTPLFTPFLTLFLSLSVLIFFCVLCSIPYGFFLWILDYLVLVWDFLLQKSSASWLYGFAIPSEWILFLFAFFNTIFLLYSLRFSHQKRLQLLLVYSGLLIGFFWCYTKIPKPERNIQYGEKAGELVLYSKNSTRILIDQGFFARSKSPESWVRYTLIPSCIKQFGSNKFNVVIVHKWTMQSIKMITSLLEYCDIKHLIVPEWQNSKIAESEYFHSLIDKVTQSCVTMISIKEKHALCVFQDVTIGCTYNQKKHCLEAWRNTYGAKKSVIHYRV
jgi:hypothetical protein